MRLSKSERLSLDLSCLLIYRGLLELRQFNMAREAEMKVKYVFQ